MATKKVSIIARPTTAEVPRADAWVANREAGEAAVVPEPVAEPMKRLTIDLPESLHHALKLYCLVNRTTIADVARDLFSKQCGLQ